MKKLALVVGIDDYPEKPLSLCVQDARAVADILTSPEYGYSVVCLYDSDASRYQILSELSKALDYQPDQFIFFFAGHGIVTQVGAYLVTQDARQNDEGVELGVLSRYLQRQSEVTGQVVAILDCCHAGAALPWSSTRLIKPSDVAQGIDSATDTRVVLAACRDDEVAWEDGALGHSIFTYHLVEGLLGGATDFDGRITVGSLYNFIQPRVDATLKQQTLLRGDVGGRVVLGSGFPPRQGAPLPADLRAAILAEARQLLVEYGSMVGNQQVGWNDGGHLRCSQTLTGIVRWFDTQVSTNREIANDKQFVDLQHSVANKVAQLGSMDAGTRTTRGVLAHKLGAGGFGAVWRVDSASNGSTALKLFHPADFGERDKLELFNRGYRAMARLDHPRVVTVYEYLPAPVGFYMDYIDGPNLRQLPELITEPAETLRVLILAAETIQHAHGRGVVHRDIKPENILLSYDQESSTWWPHLTDFDLAWFSTATSVTEKSFGNLYFAPPEQLAKPHSNAARSKAVDIYAFGQLLYFSITGSNPTPFAFEQNLGVLKDRISSWRSGKAANKVISLYSVAVAEDPAARYPDFHTLISDLASAEVAARIEDANAVLGPEAFLQEIAFGLSGFEDREVFEGQAFRSISGRTEMEFTFTNASSKDGVPTTTLNCTLAVAVLEIQGVSSERAKALLLQRVNAVVGSLPDVSRKGRTKAAFAVDVIFSRLPRTYQSVLHVRETIGKVIESIER